MNEDSREPLENPVSRVIRKGLVVGLANHTLLIAKDGTEYPIADSGAPIRDKKGETLGVVLVFRDQTAERESLKELESREAIIGAFFDTCPDGIMLTEPNGKIFKVNEAACEMLAMSEEELLTIGREGVADSTDSLLSKALDERSETGS